MPVTMDTSGRVLPVNRGLGSDQWPDETVRPGVGKARTWASLDAFTQGYIEAMFFTEQDNFDEQAMAAYIGEGGEDSFTGPALGFSSLAPEALAAIIEDCAAFQTDAVREALRAVAENDSRDYHDTIAGRDFWFTRNGHGCGFWDGDWPEPYATQLTKAAKAFGEVYPSLGDDDKVYLD